MREQTLLGRRLLQQYGGFEGECRNQHKLALVADLDGQRSFHAPGKGFPRQFDQRQGGLHLDRFQVREFQSEIIFDEVVIILRIEKI